LPIFVTTITAGFITDQWSDLKTSHSRQNQIIVNFSFYTGTDLSHSVLVVDDEPMARTLIRLMLVRAGFEVVEAEDGFDALTKVTSVPPDLMILDVMMPGMDGFAVCRAIREDERMDNLPIIMLSAKTDVESINRGMQVGANKYLTKPVSPEELTRHVREALGANNLSS
jgi:DNA-binding response OmpR family regulator